jgi:hypothetical protein
MDILLIMLLIWGYNEQPKDVKEEEPEIVPIQESVVPDNAVNVTEVTQTAAVLTAVGQALSGTNSTTSTEQAIIDELNNTTETTTVTATNTTSSSSSTSSSTST